MRFGMQMDVGKWKVTQINFLRFTRQLLLR